jgi:hypothetical protein
MKTQRECVLCRAPLSDDVGVDIRSLTRGVLGRACSWEHAQDYYHALPEHLKGNGYTMYLRPLRTDVTEVSA